MLVSAACKYILDQREISFKFDEKNYARWNSVICGNFRIGFETVVGNHKPINSVNPDYFHSQLYGLEAREIICCLHHFIIVRRSCHSNAKSYKDFSWKSGLETIALRLCNILQTYKRMKNQNHECVGILLQLVTFSALHCQIFLFILVPEWFFPEVEVKLVNSKVRLIS